jgi:hypothetical protein
MHQSCRRESPLERSEKVACGGTQARSYRAQDHIELAGFNSVHERSEISIEQLKCGSINTRTFIPTFRLMASRTQALVWNLDERPGSFLQDSDNRAQII